jgi:ascorbate-specific PTS system EIIC-type component UlaA
MYLLCGLLFFLLSPGVLLTIPPGSKGLFVSGQTSILAAAVHAVVFVVVSCILWNYVIHPSLNNGVYVPKPPSVFVNRCNGGITPCNNNLDCRQGSFCVNGSCV